MSVTNGAQVPKARLVASALIALIVAGQKPSRLMSRDFCFTQVPMASGQPRLPLLAARVKANNTQTRGEQQQRGRKRDRGRHGGRKLDA